MKTRLPTSFGGMLLILAVAGCSSPMRFSQYSGTRRHWATSTEAMAETSFALPVYRTWPDKPYEVLGTLRFENPNQYWDDGVIKAAVAEAKSKAGDAIIIRHGSEFGVSGNIGSAEDPMMWRQDQITALVVKWKSKSAVDSETAALRTFKENFRAKYAELCRSAPLFDSAVDYLRWTGVSLDSGPGTEKLKDVLTQIHDTQQGELDGKWLYRCGYSRSRLTSSYSDFFWGVASVTLKDNVLTVVSTSGPEVNFSGSFDRGRVTGKMGIGSVSINCDGVASKDKTSLSGQGQVADGIFQASLVFQR